ncbi:hypothetical protein JNB_18528 [Janibacter sp. HTCC2649]|uniref:hypothetical protein n=1 Tax=Janibacter sp. HTCC2649 TaxID=313589 RepID=UPI000067101A|nr:hypothetical protein [Janibacter sp. HTCC2649]EAP97494.1 hypothetical protein JNB_18528 [Janibacter sp. HTCC2649]
MKVVLLSTRRLRAHMIDTSRAELGLDPGDAQDLTVVTWNPPIGRLRVAQHLVVGPILSPTGKVRFARVDPVEQAPPETTSSPADDATAPDVAVADPADDASIEDDSFADPEDRDDQDDQDDAAVVRTGTRRVGHAVKWRANRARLSVQGHPVAQRIGASTKVRRLRAAITPGGLATHFALGCSRSPVVRRAVEGADLVVALDQNSQRAAWLLARRIAGPDVVVGIPAGARLVALKRDGGLS